MKFKLVTLLRSTLVLTMSTALERLKGALKILQEDPDPDIQQCYLTTADYDTRLNKAINEERAISKIADARSIVQSAFRNLAYASKAGETDNNPNPPVYRVFYSLHQRYPLSILHLGNDMLRAKFRSYQTDFEEKQDTFSVLPDVISSFSLFVSSLDNYKQVCDKYKEQSGEDVRRETASSVCKAAIEYVNEDLLLDIRSLVKKDSGKYGKMGTDCATAIDAANQTTRNHLAALKRAREAKEAKAKDTTKEVQEEANTQSQANSTAQTTTAQLANQVPQVEKKENTTSNDKSNAQKETTSNQTQSKPAEAETTSEPELVAHTQPTSNQVASDGQVDSANANQDKEETESTPSDGNSDENNNVPPSANEGNE